MTAFEWKTFFVWRVTYIYVHVTQAQFLPTSSKHVSPGMQFLGLGIGGLSHQSCMSLHIGTNNIVGGSIKGMVRNSIPQPGPSLTMTMIMTMKIILLPCNTSGIHSYSMTLTCYIQQSVMEI